MRDEIKVGSRWRCAGGPEYEVEVKGVDGTDTFWSRPYVSFVPVAGGAMETYNAGRFRRAFVPCEAPAFIPVAAPAPREVPAHYAGAVEPLAAIRAWGLNFAMGCVVKHVARAGRKGPRLDDLLKARAYLDDEIAAEKGGAE